MSISFLPKRAGRGVLVCLSLLSLNAYSQDIRWEKSYGGKHAEYLFDVQPTADYGFILAGSSVSGKTGKKTQENHGDLDYWLWKMDEDGEMDWQKSFGGSGFDMLHSVRLTNDGGFILGGTSDSPAGLDKKEASKGGTDFWVIKLDAAGGEQWQKTIGGTSADELKYILPTRDGGYLLGGNSASSPTKSPSGEWLGDKTEPSRGNMDYWIVKLDASGNIKWQKTYGGQFAEQLRSLSLTSDGGCIAGGYSNSPASGDKAQANYGAGDFWILKLSETGDIQWQQTYGGEQDEQLYSIFQTLDGNYIAGGNSNSGATGNRSASSRKGSDFWLLKMDEKGESLWQQSYDFGQNDILTSLVENKDGSLLIGGYAKTETMDPAKTDKKEINDYIALKVDAKGEEKWNRIIGSNGQDILKKLIETRDGGYLMAGTSSGKVSRDRHSSIGGNDFWVVKLKDKEKKEKERSNIEAIPNPSGGYTNVIVGYEFEKGTATVFDLGGRQLQSFEITTGRTVPVDLNGLPEGIYVVHIKTEKSSDSVKVMKTK